MLPKIQNMAKVDVKSPDAIRIYMLVGAIVSGFLLSYFLIVPILKNTCTWFTTRCGRVTVQTGADHSLLVTVPPYQYFYDGVQFIYAYGDALAGTCPKIIADGVQPDPVISPPVSSFCFRWKLTPDDPECLAGNRDKCVVCAEPLQQLCARGASATGDGKFTCDGGATVLDSAKCCEFIPPCANDAQCNVTIPATKQADGSYTCAKGVVDGNLCNMAPKYEAGKGYTCDGGVTFTDKPQCCDCSNSFQAVTYAGTTSAVNAYQPVYTVNAQTMKLLPQNQGVACGLKQNIVQQMFQYRAKQDVKVTLPQKDAMLDMYQVFDVLRANGIFRPPVNK